MGKKRYALGRPTHGKKMQKIQGITLPEVLIALLLITGTLLGLVDRDGNTSGLFMQLAMSIEKAISLENQHELIKKPS